MTGESSTFLQALIAALDTRVQFPRDAEAPPVAILWPDKTRQWEEVIPRLAEERPVLTLGDYSPKTWTGPAIWIRCVVDGAVPRPEAAGVPIIYLPGYERSEVRLPEEAPAELRPLLELQYRGVIFAQLSNRDWTIPAFLQAAPARGGLGIEVGTDDGTKTAMRAALPILADWLVENLRRKAPLRAEFFNEIVVPGSERQLLQWLNDPTEYAARHSPDEVRAFKEVCISRYGVDVDVVGEIAVAQALGLRANDAWASVWRLFADAPEWYPNIEDRLRAAKPPQVKEKRQPGTLGLFDARDAWPQENEAEEALLRAALKDLGGLDDTAARDRLAELEQEHRERRRWVWARRGRAPLAFAMEPLADLARATRRHIPAAGVQDIVDAYTDWAWLADDAVMRALGVVETAADVEAVGIAIASVYRGWLEVGAERLQAAIGPTASDYVVEPLASWPDGTVVIFTDGLRYDVGRRLAEALRLAGMTVDVEVHLASLPTITPSGKPAVSPAMSRLIGGPGLGPVAPVGAAASLSADGLRREIAGCGYQVLGMGDIGVVGGKAWAEQGDIDSLGHDEVRLASLLDSEIRRLELRIVELLEAGWTQVVVITDHGWLFLPGGLPKAELPLHLAQADMRKGRAARLLPGAAVDVPVVPWTWDSAVRIAMAPGISCFSGTRVYEHGGISPQECITPVVIARAGVGQAGPVEAEVSWAGLRANVTTVGAPIGSLADLRRKAGDPASSLLGGGRPLDELGAASFLVADDDLIGSAAFLVITTATGGTLASRNITVGENN